MRITKISVKGLFGMFDHEIPLNQESRITTVYGPNGVGKTVLIRMVHGLFHYDYDFLDSIPFEQFRIDFENGYSAIVEKNISGEASESETILLVLYMDNNGEKIDSFVIRIVNDDFFNKIVERFHPELVQVIMSPTPLGSIRGTRYWISKDDKYMGEHNLLQPLTKQDIMRRNPEIHAEACGEVPDWFAIVQQKASPEHIPMARLTSPTWDYSFFASWEWNRNVLQEDDGVYMVPSRPDAVTEIQRAFISDFKLRKKIRFLDKWTREEEELQAVLEVDAVHEREAATHILGDLIEDRQRKIDEILDDIDYRPVKLFFDLFNQRILFKYLRLDREAEIKAYMDDGSEVPLTTLSSGEQQLLVLYYQLLFKTGRDSLVMIDEPELSMNVVWQRNFIKDLQRIIELRKFDVLIATHSPMIIHDKWDWVVHLGEKVDD